jgi:NitT/TauT family transport system ATP-binding protein
VSAAQVKLRGVTKAFPSGAGGGVVHALGPIDIEIRKGDFFVVWVHPAAESQRPELIADLTHHGRKKIEFEGRAIRRAFPWRRRRFQEDACFPGLVCAKTLNLAYGKEHQRGEKTHRATAVIEMMGHDLRDIIRRNCLWHAPARLHRAHYRGPRLILLDEPFARLIAGGS